DHQDIQAGTERIPAEPSPASRIERRSLQLVQWPLFTDKDSARRIRHLDARKGTDCRRMQHVYPHGQFLSVLASRGGSASAETENQSAVQSGEASQGIFGWRGSSSSELQAQIILRDSHMGLGPGSFRYRPSD